MSLNGEHLRELECLQEFCRQYQIENTQLKDENAAQAKRIAELEAIDEKQLEEILFTVTDGLATHNLRFVMLDSINHILKRSAQKGTES